MGIPSFVVTRSGFTKVVNNSFQSLGFPGEAPTMLEFPMEMFVAGSDLSPLSENIDKLVYGLTKWEPKIKKKGVQTQAEIKVEGKDYADAVHNMNFLFMKNMWNDGLPLEPATKERVNWILTGTDLSPDKVLGAVGPRGGIASVEQVAVALAMAGGRPEYMPVLIAATEAMANEKYMWSSQNATTNAVSPVVIVNGPIAKQIRLNSGYGCLGPDPVHPAGGNIGRALRIMQLAMGGSIPGSGSMSTYGGPARYANVVFAEDEDGNPWEPLSVERGFPRGSNVVTVLGAATFTNITQAETSTKETALRKLLDITRIMVSDNGNMFGARYCPDGYVGTLLMATATAHGIKDNLGWSKKDLKAYLWKNTKVPWDMVKALGINSKENVEYVKRYGIAEGEPWPIAPSPNEIVLVIAGGEQSGHLYWMRRPNYPRLVQSNEIRLPAKAKWDVLLKEAEKDLGPAPND
jgi:hypothetical protein